MVFTIGSLFVSTFDSPGALRRYDVNSGAFLSSASNGLSLGDGVALWPVDNVYVVTVGTTDVLRHSGTTGAFMNVYVSGGLSQPRDLEFGADGTLYITDINAGAVLQYDPGTNSLSTFVSGLNGPRGLDFDPTGNLYVANSFNGTVT